MADPVSFPKELVHSAHWTKGWGDYQGLPDSSPALAEEWGRWWSTALLAATFGGSSLTGLGLASVLDEFSSFPSLRASFPLLR